MAINYLIPLVRYNLYNRIFVIFLSIKTDLKPKVLIDFYNF